MMVQQPPSSKARLRATIAAAAASILAAGGLLATVGMGFASMLAWTCTHNPDAGAGCEAASTAIRLLLVLALCLVPAWLLFPHVRRWMLARLPD